MQESDGQPGEVETETVTDWDSHLQESLQSLEAESTEDSQEEPLQAEAPESEETDSETEQDSTEPLEPLEQWKEEDRQYFTTLDRQAQEFLLNRHKELEGGFTQKTQEIAEERKRLESINEVVSPYETILKQQGHEVAPVIAQAMNLLASVNKDPVAAVKQAIQAYNITPEMIGVGVEDDLTDPTIKAQNERIAALEQRLQQQAQAAKVQESQEGQAQIDAFKSATNEDGSSKYPHFDSLRTLMAPLVQNGKTLEEAYEEASYTIPEVREGRIKAEAEAAQKAAEEAAEAKRKDKLKKAKSADTLPSSDVDAEDLSLPESSSWEQSLQHTLEKLTH